MEGVKLTKEFSESKKSVNRVLDEIDFQVKKGEFLSVIGPSGCGKSTLIRMLAGLESITDGQILLDGKPVTRPGSERGMVFQKYTLFPWLTVLQNVMFGLECIGKSKEEAESTAVTWIEIVGLAKYADYYPSKLSGGMQQRVAIARALAPNPKILLMDEPFGALDAQTRADMQSYLLEVWKEFNITILFVTHDLDEAVYLSDRILVLKANPGKVNRIIDVNLPRPRTPEVLFTEEFKAYREEIESLIRPKVDYRKNEEFKIASQARQVIEKK